jgi:hypothetical protein
MRAPATIMQSPKVTPVVAFKARCEARALLVAFGEIDLRDAVDKLQADAVRDGLVDEIGQDAVQAMMDEAFRIVPPEARVRQGPKEEDVERGPGHDRIPEVTIEALMYALRRGLSGLDDPRTRDRLRRCDPEAMKRIAERLLTLSERTAACRESWSQGDVTKLVAVWRALRAGR